MATGAAFFTIFASSVEADKNTPDPNLLGFTLLLFSSGMSWLVLNSRYSGRDWYDLLTYGGSCSGASIGLSQLLLGISPLAKMGLAMCAWAVAVTVIVSRDSLREYRDYYELEARREESIPEYAIGTPRDPAWEGNARNLRQMGGAGDMTSSLPDGQTEEAGSKV